MEVIGDAGWLTLEEIYWYGSKRCYELLTKYLKSHFSEIRMALTRYLSVFTSDPDPSIVFETDPDPRSVPSKRVISS